ncbi:uncharacterized protein LOC143037395 [Oratosquilla oratoria]|uniref:uncharacterized protein LOC143037395 n=1 Tax=Oratosquilla oratoria TaxID=337810 RepID=UPI003F776515
MECGGKETSENELFQHIWQKRNIDIKKQDPKGRADTNRFDIAQYQYSEILNKYADKSWLEYKIKSLYRSYGNLMDTSLPEGINNYAEPILTLSRSGKNDSQDWVSGLNLKDLKRMTEKYIKAEKGATVVSEEEYSQLAAKLNQSKERERKTKHKKDHEKEDYESEELSSQGVSFDLFQEDLPADMKCAIESSQDVGAFVSTHSSGNMGQGRAEPGNGTYGRGHRGTGRGRGMYPWEMNRSQRDDLQSFSDINRRAFSDPNVSHNQGHSKSDRNRFGPGSESLTGNMKENFPRGSHGNFEERHPNSSLQCGRGRQIDQEYSNNSSIYRKGPQFEEVHWNRSSQYGRGPRGFRRGHSGDRGRGHQEPYPWQRSKTKAACVDPQDNFKSGPPDFRTASHQLVIEQQKKFGNGGMSASAYGTQKRSLGARRNVGSRFVPPVKQGENEGPLGSKDIIQHCGPKGGAGRNSEAGGSSDFVTENAELLADERLKGIEPRMVELILNEIMESGAPVGWDDIAGLELAKTTIQEIVVWPMLRPDIFTGLRGPPKGILLFGPPGTGKTMIGKCIASQSRSTFFSISASSLTSKWVGEGEKMVRALFAVARVHQPAVIFIDEIDSLLTQRSDTEHESSRRIKTEFLVQLDGATTSKDERLLLVGATNRPQELDEAARRRLVKRLYIPLPDSKARKQIMVNLLSSQTHNLSPEDMDYICDLTNGYSGADMANLCREAALGPIRSINFADIEHISVDQVRPMTQNDFVDAVRCIRASVSGQDMQMYEEWNAKFGIAAH